MATSDRRRRRSVCGLIAIGLIAMAGCTSTPAIVRLGEARRSAVELNLQFARATDAANKAVMAETDEASAAFARDAEQAKAAVTSGIATLDPLLKGLNYSEEAQILQEFAEKFTEYRELDARILTLAVENTNVKAQRIAFGPALATADAFRDALESLTPADAADAWRLKAVTATAVARTREIQAIQAPHIADANDAAMASLETRMGDAEKAARAALDALAHLVSPASRTRLAEARTSLDRFMELNAEIVSLSRRNTNVRSLALTLNDKGKLTADCEGRLHALTTALAARQLGGTR